MGWESRYPKTSAQQLMPSINRCFMSYSFAYEKNFHLFILSFLRNLLFSKFLACPETL
jgi:hypothetical protein